MELYTAPPPGSTVICADELGPVIPRTFPPAPGWSPGGHRIKAPLEYSRGPEKTWVYGGLRVADGHAVTMCASSRNSAFYQDFLQLEEQANPEGTIWVITDNLSSHDSKSTRVGFRNSAMGLDLGFYAARSYSLMKPPRTGRRLIRSRERSATGWSGRGGRSCRLRWGRRPL